MGKEKYLLMFIFFIIICYIMPNLSNSAIIGPPYWPVGDPNNDDFIDSNNPNHNLYNETGWQGVDGKSGSGFDIKDSGGTTEYFISWAVSNNSGINWTGYNFILALQIEPDYIYSNPNDGLDFDAPLVSATPIPSSSIPLALEHTPDALYWAGTIPNGVKVNFTFSIDVPDNLGMDMFYLIEYPSVSSNQNQPTETGSSSGGCFLQLFRKLNYE